LKAFHCGRCGQRVFFDSIHCTRCNAVLGFDPRRIDMLALDTAQDPWRSDDGSLYRPCRNRIELDMCNWLVPAEDIGDYCASCRRTAVIPNLGNPVNVDRLAALERAKRHLLYSLLVFGLPLDGGGGFPYDLRFQFLEDQRSNPLVAEKEVKTGHLDGMITINVLEADDAERESTRNAMREHYRTLLGHFRHESGHYYFQRLLRQGPWLARFIEAFGDPDADYAAALERYYRDGAPSDRQYAFVSAYASAHPLEDWAETWAHYLHMTDTLETAASFEIGRRSGLPGDPVDMIDRWIDLSTAMNALNRSMGLPDPYPFVLSDEVRDKIAFVHRFIADSASPS
jgi:hypothetical protein